jgi:hypothetical protein
MEIELPRLEEKNLFFGPFRLSLEKCNLDHLIEIFGEPKFGGPFYDSNLRMITFDYAYGEITAFVAFQDKKANIDFYTKDFDSDRGILAELHLVLHEPGHLKMVQGISQFINNGFCRLAVLDDIRLLRMVSRRRFDAISFINPNLIGGAEDSILYACGWCIVPPTFNEQKVGLLKEEEKILAHFGDYAKGYKKIIES